MSLWRDEKFLRLVSPQLDRFTHKKANHYGFRCPLCGDSETNKLKARGYIFPLQDVLMFKCHNCSIALPFSALLKRLDTTLYDEYIMERVKEDRQTFAPPTFTPTVLSVPVAAPKPVPHAGWPIHDLASLSAPSHPLHAAYLWAVAERKLPAATLPRLFATDKAHTWLTMMLVVYAPVTDAHRKEALAKAKTVQDGVIYLVQPFRLPSGEWYGAQLRMVDQKKFYTFRWSHDPLKVFGLDAWNPAKFTYVVEGPMDALFVPNALAACGPDLVSSVQILDDLRLVPPGFRRAYVWDNEPRNSDIRRHMRNAIRLHEPVVIWPRHYPKDINDMIRAGIDVNTVLPKRIFTGMIAELEFSSWQKA